MKRAYISKRFQTKSLAMINQANRIINEYAREGSENWE